MIVPYLLVFYKRRKFYENHSNVNSNKNFFQGKQFDTKKNVPSEKSYKQWDNWEKAGKFLGQTVKSKRSSSHVYCMQSSETPSDKKIFYLAGTPLLL